MKNQIRNNTFLFFQIALCLLAFSINAQESIVPKDTSFTALGTYKKIKKARPYVELVKPVLPENVQAFENIIYQHIQNSPYGNRQLKLNVYRPKDSRKYPVLLMVHGGAWCSGDYSMEVPMAQQIAARGYVTIPLEYRLSPEAAYPAALHDVKTAVRWVRANAEKYHMDPSKIAVSGTSAGGHLAALAGMTNGSSVHEGKGDYPGFSSEIQAVIDLDGVVTMVQKEQIEETDVNIIKNNGVLSKNAFWLTGSYKNAKKVWEEASPLLWAGKKSAAICFINSDAERYHYGRDELRNKLQQYNIASEVHEMQVDYHAFWLFRPWFDKTIGFMTTYLDKTFKQQK